MQYYIGKKSLNRDRQCNERYREKEKRDIYRERVRQTVKERDIYN